MESDNKIRTLSLLKFSHFTIAETEQTTTDSDDQSQTIMTDVDNPADSVRLFSLSTVRVITRTRYETRGKRHKVYITGRRRARGRPAVAAQATDR